MEIVEFAVALEHIKFILHHEDCSSFCWMLISLILGGGILMWSNLLSVSECDENVAISRYFQIHKALNNKILKTVIHMRLLTNHLIRLYYRNKV